MLEARLPYRWEKSYPPGIGWDAAIATGTLGGLIDRVASYGPRIAIEYRDREISYAELARRVDGIAAGLHTVIDLPPDGPTENEVIEHLAVHDIAVHGLAGYRHRVVGRTPAALVVGFATPPEHAFALGARALATALADIYR